MRETVIGNDIFMEEVQRLLEEGHEVVILAKGWSMTPFIRHEKDHVVLVRDGDIEKGKVVLAHLASGHWVLHRIIRVLEDGVVLMGDGNLEGTEQCRKQDIVAFATHVRHQNGRTVRIKDKPLWRLLLPIRPLLLKIYFHFHENG